MTSLSVSSISTTQTVISRWYLQNWMSCIAPNANRRETNWRNGCAARNNPGEQSHAGILRDWRFGQAAESEPGNCLQICDAQEAIRRLTAPALLEFAEFEMRTGILMKRSRSSTTRACCIRTRVC